MVMLQPNLSAAVGTMLGVQKDCGLERRKGSLLSI